MPLSLRYQRRNRIWPPPSKIYSGLGPANCHVRGCHSRHALLSAVWLKQLAIGKNGGGYAILRRFRNWVALTLGFSVGPVRNLSLGAAVLASFAKIFINTFPAFEGAQPSDPKVSRYADSLLSLMNIAGLKPLRCFTLTATIY